MVEILSTWSVSSYQCDNLESRMKEKVQYSLGWYELVGNLNDHFSMYKKEAENENSLYLISTSVFIFTIK